MAYEIGVRIRKYREAQKLSQKEFATLIGVSNSRVSNWEQGINRPDVGILSKICEIFKISPVVFLNLGANLLKCFYFKKVFEITTKIIT